jgi:hypothetical protein
MKTFDTQYFHRRFDPATRNRVEFFEMQPVSTKDPVAVQVEVQVAMQSMFPAADPLFVPRVFSWVMNSFTGHYADYQPIDAKYHDLEHTLQGTLCMARILHGRHQANAEPVLTLRMVQLGIIAILLHDTGYLKKNNDRDGTGAKYTVTHVERSAEFAGKFLASKDIKPEEIQSIQNMIRCTGVDADLVTIPFGSEMEKITGFALGTADLVGQMAATDYVDKLPILYSEFAEAARYSDTPSLKAFSSADDLVQKTPGFWENYVRPKLNRDFGGLYRFLNSPYPYGPNYYLDRIESNMERIRRRSAGLDTTMFHKSAAY